ncbi:MAG: CHAT domain-containing protein, partial [Saprospiraceae bacterium]
NFQIFHFAGHAFDQKLQFQNDLELASTCMVFSAGLADVITRFQDLKLVFLNGCSTAGQVQFFLDQGVEAVIATTMPLKDRYGFQFAQRFYESFFKSELSLEEASDYALLLLKSDCGACTQGWFNDNLTNAMERGGLAIDATPRDRVYELHLATPAAGRQKVGDWATPVPHTAMPLRPARDTQRVPLDCALLCNRSDESGHFEEVLENLVDTRPQLPYFFFIHELEEACPLRLPERFEKFGLPGFCTTNRLDSERFSWKTLELPERRHLRDDLKCRWRLSEIYSHHFPGEPDQTQGRYLFKQPEQGDRVLLIHHDLNYFQVEWHDSLRRLFDFYLGEFSQVLATELNSRMVILFSVEYYDSASPFRNLFNQLAADHGDRVRNLTGMSPIRRVHVGNWRRKVFKGRPETDVPEMEEIFPFDDEATMLDTQKALTAALKKYNEKLSTAHA